MEPENMTPIPEQPQPEQSAPQPPVQPAQRPAPPQYRQPAPPQYRQPAQPQYQPPAQPQYPRYQLQYPQYAQPQQAQPAEPKKKTAAWKIVVPIVAGVLVLAILVGVCFLFLRSTPVEKLTLSETEIVLRPEDGYELYFTFAPADADGFDYTWSSSDPSVATVENGGVTAVGTGECLITLRAGNGATASCKVTVAAPAADKGDIVGTWRFNGAVIDGETYQANEADVKLFIYANGAAEIVIDGKKTGLSWSFNRREDGVDLYDVLAEDGTVCTFLYYGDLTLYGDEHNSMNFQR